MIHLLAAILLAQAPVTEIPRGRLSGYAQPQYDVRTVNGETTDRTLFRRLVISLDASISENWKALVQVDAGPLASSGDRPVIKNAHVAYHGWRDRGLTFTLGNQKMPMSRGLLRSSMRRGAIERSFTEDRAFGAPGRALSVRLEGSHFNKRMYWMATAGDTRQVTNPDEIRIDGASEAGSRGNQGPIVGGRLEWHPLGEMTRDHGDFARGPLRVTVGTSAYRWSNDGDVAPHGDAEVDASRVYGVEVSGGLRGGGWSLDAEYDRIAADAALAGTTLGLYLDGRARLHKGSIEAGYTVLFDRLEALATVDVLDSLSFVTPWRRVGAGMNWYIRGHDLKVSLLHRESFDERGVSGARSRVTFLQTQIVF